MRNLLRQKILVIGGGGHACVVIDCALALGAQVLGALDAHKKAGGAVLGNIKTIGKDSDIVNYTPADIILLNGIGSVRDTDLRTGVFLNFKNKGYEFATLIHPAAYVSKYASVGEGSVILAGAIIGTNARIGKNVIVNTRASVDHNCEIKDHAHIAPGVTLSGDVTIGQGCHIGAGATIIQGKTIEANSLVKAGQIIT